MSTLFVVSLVLVGCGKKDTSDPVVEFSDDDPKMNAAIAKAKSSVKSFITAIKSPKPGQSGFSVKVPFRDNGKTEHMWIQPVTYEGGKFNGVIANEAQMVQNVKIGQKVSISEKEISDWMYIDKRKLVGGETIRVMRDSLSAREKEEFDKGMPFTID